MRKPAMLMILDGFGISDDIRGNAIRLARTENLDRIFEKYPNTTLGASGMDVGLPDGQMGNSEVGHLNIGSGRIVYQELTRITKAISDGSFYHNAALLSALDHVASNGSRLHLAGLLSDGGVHSHIDHLKALLDLAKSANIDQVFIHALLDGRDVPPRSAGTYISELETYMQSIGIGRIASISGRYFGMDRDNRWQRVQLSYDAMTLGKGHVAPTAEKALADAYKRGENDEFIVPTVIEGTGGSIVDHDAVIMFNFRPDRARELTRCFTDPDFTGFARTAEPRDLCYVCMTQYDSEMPNVKVAFEPQSLANTLSRHLAALGLTQLHIAETEKYAHVTFFFNGGVEDSNPGEDRILIPSPKVATYDLQPEMSAYLVAEKTVEMINTDKYDVIILNFANPDMVGHTGVLPAAVRAIEAIDECVCMVTKAILAKDGFILLTADHGNAEKMLDEHDQPFTAHTLNRVPFIVLSDRDHLPDQPLRLRSDGILADIAPTLLDMMGLSKPAEMTGTTLILK